MDFLVKIGDKREQSDPAWQYDYRDGHIVNVRPSGFYDNSIRTLSHFAVLRFTPDFFTSIGASDYQSTRFKTAHPAFIAIKKYMYKCDLSGKMPWDNGYIEPSSFYDKLMRLYYFDFDSLLSSGWITQSQYDNLYNKDQIVEPINITPSFLALLKNEIDHPRIPSQAAIRAIGTIDAGGTYTVGTAQTYADMSTAIADLPADIGAMTTPGNIVLQGNTTEELTESTSLLLSLDTDIYTLTLNVHTGHKHSGGAYGSGHRIAFTSYDDIRVYEASGGTTNNVIIQDLAIDAAGTSNIGVHFDNGGDSGHLIVEKCVIKGDVNAQTGIYMLYGATNCIARNNVCYGFTDTYSATGGAGIIVNDEFGSGTYEIYNNTLAKNDVGIGSPAATPAGTIILKNNLCVGNVSNDYVDANSSFDTTSQNVASDATSPDAKNNWAGTANMVDYANDDYQLDATDSVLDDADDLSAIGSPAQFSDDNTDQARTTWFCGAHEYTGAAPSGNPWYYYAQQG